MTAGSGDIDRTAEKYTDRCKNRYEILCFILIMNNNHLESDKKKDKNAFFVLIR